MITSVPAGSMGAVPQPTARKGSETPPSRPAPPPRTVRGVVAVTALEAVLLIVLALALIVATILSEPTSLFGSLGGAVLALVAAAGLFVLLPHLLRCRRFARSPVVVLQLLWLPVGYSLAFQAGRPQYGIPVLVLALTTLGLFATPSARAALTQPLRSR